jgi:hypothetical protein
MSKLDQLLDQGEAHARQILLVDKKPDLVPFYHLVSDGVDTIMPCTFGSQQEKDLAVFFATALARSIDATAVMFVSEAWTAVVAPGDVSPDGMVDVLPSQRSDRVEVVMLVASDGDHSLGRSLLMKRDRKGRLVALERDDKYDRADMFGGRMIDGIIPPTQLH